MEKVISIKKHKVSNASAQDDPTYENYLRLAEWIFAGKVDTSDLQDKVEERKRMKEIDNLRASGNKTEYEKETIKNRKIYDLEERKYSNKKICIETINTKTKEKIFYNSMAEFCVAINISRDCIKNRFKKAQSNKILYKGLIIRKIEKNSLECEIQAHRLNLNPLLDMDNYKTVWNEYEKAFVAQNRPKMKWKDISICLGRTTESCSTMLTRIKKEDKLEIYRNIDISDKFKL